MPRRTDIESVLVIGSGPIVIGQACEFDYSGTQAVKALKEEGYRVVLVNSNPATIMTDPEFADATYIEPLTVDTLARIIERERPDTLLPTLGGQTALNLSVDLARTGVLARFDVELIGARREAIEKAEDRAQFKAAMERIGLKVPGSAYVRNLDEAREAARALGFPLILRPSFTLGGVGGGIAYHAREYEERVAWALAQSPTASVLVEASVLGWKEFELEVMRDRADNVVIICSIENFDPMGVHTGDSITVAPAQTLTDVEYQRMRDAAIAVIREIGVDTGGSNIQFAVNPDDGELVVIEMNPRVSRSSALASKATGFPIAKIATKLAVGYTLDELRNDITRETPASFEPTLDYVVVKIPRFTFEKFPETDDTLTTQMKSVGEAMAIGRTFREALQKALRSLETDVYGLERPRRGLDREVLPPDRPVSADTLRVKLATPTPDRLLFIAEALRSGFDVGEVSRLTRIDPWFLHQVASLVDEEAAIRKRYSHGTFPDAAELRRLKQLGFSDRRLAALTGRREDDVRAARGAALVRPVYKRVDTCACEFEAHTPYLYSTWEEECEAAPSDRKKVVILGGGPNRIGQGIEFDYCCVHAAFALSADGYETIMVNCNPETVSTDYDTSDRLYFEPLTLEDVVAIVRREQERGEVLGAIVQFGGQTPLKLARGLEAAGVPILGTSPDAIDRAEDRDRFRALLEELGLAQPTSRIVRDEGEARRAAAELGYPILVRPSYVLGGRGMFIAWDDAGLDRAIHESAGVAPEHPLLVDRYLANAVELDVDCVADGEEAIIGGVMEHIEEAGIHSGDSACCLPPHNLAPEIVRRIETQTLALARALGVVGLMNVQFAVQGDDVYVLEVNPRASRTVPFVGKATGRPLAQIAARCMVGRTLREMGVQPQAAPAWYSVKEAVFPFNRFPGVDTLLGPEMKSTGEVMGVAPTFGEAFAKAQKAAGNALPERGAWLVTVKDEDKPAAADIAARLHRAGFEVLATAGTAAYLNARGVPAETVRKVSEGRPHCVDRIAAGEVAAVFNTVHGRHSKRDSYEMRRQALVDGVAYFTTVAAANAGALGVEAMRRAGAAGLGVVRLQDLYAGRWQGPREDEAWQCNASP
jgi:carbamoyl-phosphate synthase large subunit